MSQSLFEKIKSLLGAKDKGPDQSIEAGLMQDDKTGQIKVETGAKKRPNPIVIGAVILGVAFIVYDEFLVEKPVEAPKAAAPKKNSRRLNPNPVKAPVAKDEVAKKVEVTKLEQKTQAPVEAEKAPEKMPEKVVVQPTPEAPEVMATPEVEVKEEVAEAPVEEVKEELPPASARGEEKVAITKSDNQVIEEESARPASGSDYFSDLIFEIENEVEKEKVAVKQTKRPSNPDYNRGGRGLVYNCSGGHWACLDQTAFEDCKTVAIWEKKQGRSLACVPIQVYASLDDCARAQLEKINNMSSKEICTKYVQAKK